MQKKKERNFSLIQRVKRRKKDNLPKNPWEVKWKEEALWWGQSTT